eukprot:gene7663-8468_t
MGNCISNPDLSYATLKKSAIGSFIPDSAFTEFFHLCRGEVVALLSCENAEPVIGAVYRPGDVIFFSPVVSLSHTSGGLTFGKYRIVYQMRSLESGLAQVIGADRDAMDGFLKRHPQCTELADFLCMDLKSYLVFPGFSDLSIQQLSVMSALMKVRRCSEGQVVKEATVSFDAENQGRAAGVYPEVITRTPDANLRHGRRRKLQELLVPTLPPGERCLGLLLQGSCVSLPPDIILQDLLKQALDPLHQPSFSTLDVLSTAQLGTVEESPTEVQSLPLQQQEQPKATTPNSAADLSPQRMMSVIRESSRNKLLAGAKTKPSSAVLQVYNVTTDDEHLSASDPSESDELSDIEVYPGSFLGLESLFIESNTTQIDSLLSLTSSVVALWDWISLRALFHLDPLIKRTLRRNYQRRLIDSVRSQVGMLKELDDTMYSSLCSKVSLKGFRAGEVLFAKDSPCTTSYIVLTGVVQEVGETGSTRPIMDKPVEEYEDVRFLGAGSLFGEASLVMESPYFSTTTAMEACLVVCVSKRTLDLVYNKDKAKLAEVRIRLAGMETDLETILMHPTSNRLFYDFLKQEHSVENLLFYNAATKYEEMVERLRRGLDRVPIQYWIALQQKCLSKSGLIEGDEEMDMVGGKDDDQSEIFSKDGRKEVGGDDSERYVGQKLGDRGLAPEAHPIHTVSFPNLPIGNSDRKPSLFPLVAEEENDGIDNGEKEDNTRDGQGGGEGDDICNNNVTANASRSISNSNSKSKSHSRSGSSGQEALIRHIPSYDSYEYLDQPVKRKSVEQRAMAAAGAITATPSADVEDYSSGGVGISSRGGLMSHGSSSLLVNIGDISDCVEVAKAKRMQVEGKISELREVAKRIMEKFVRIRSYCEINISQTVRNDMEHLFEQWLQNSTSHCLEQLIEVILKAYASNATTTTTIISQNTSNNPINGGMTINTSLPYQGRDRNRMTSTPLLSPAVIRESRDSGRLRLDHSSSSSAVSMQPMIAPASSASVPDSNAQESTTTLDITLPYFRLFTVAKNDVLRLMKDPFLRWKKTAPFPTFIAGIKPYERADTMKLEMSYRSAVNVMMGKQMSVNSWNALASTKTNHSNHISLYVTQEEHSSHSNGSTSYFQLNSQKTPLRHAIMLSRNPSRRNRKFKAPRTKGVVPVG